MDIIQTAALFNYSNRVASALDLRPNREYHGMARGDNDSNGLSKMTGCTADRLHYVRVQFH